MNSTVCSQVFRNYDRSWNLLHFSFVGGRFICRNGRDDQPSFGSASMELFYIHSPTNTFLFHKCSFLILRVPF
jgi:hypothetical protein